MLGCRVSLVSSFEQTSYFFQARPHGGFFCFTILSAFILCKQSSRTPKKPPRGPSVVSERLFYGFFNMLASQYACVTIYLRHMLDYKASVRSYKNQHFQQNVKHL